MPANSPDPDTADARKAAASAWFESLRDRMCAAFEALEDSVEAPNDGAGPRQQAGPLRAHGVGHGGRAAAAG